MSKIIQEAEKTRTPEEEAAWQDRLFLLYDPCDSIEELREHMQVFLGLDMPYNTLDENSTSNPLCMIWEVYESMRTGKGATRHVAACSRNTAKTLTACVIRWYGIIHFRRSGTHLAATENQSESAMMYLDPMFDVPGVSEFITIRNTRKVILENLPANRHTKLSKCSLRVVVATLKGVNSQRGSLNTLDEVDLISQKIINAASHIRSPTLDEHQFEPIAIFLSSRQSPDGPIQDLVDQGEAVDPPEDLRLHKWSLVDWMKPCPPEVHKPEEERYTAWINNENLKIINDPEKYEILKESEKALYNQVDAYEGCKTCSAFPICRGRAADQDGTSPHLKSRKFVGDAMTASNDPEDIISRVLNLKGETSSIAFRHFKRRDHFLAPVEMYRFITGQDPHPGLHVTKDVIYRALREHRWDIHYGVDWGWKADSTCVVAGYNRRQNRCVVLHVEGTKETPDPVWAKHIATQIHAQFPADLICPDMAIQASPTYFAPYSVDCLTTKPYEIITGVTQLRGLLYNLETREPGFAILDDGDFGQNIQLVTAMEKWTHKKTPMGFDFDKFEDNDYCDYIDPLRYLLNPFINNNKIGISSSQSKNPSMLISPQMTEADKQVVRDSSQLKQSLQNHFLNQYGVDPTAKPEDKKNKKQGSIKFKF